ncbi:MAG: thioredoxin-dependent thiol peroxidase [Microbacteriaceae bacterium]|nr:thioredoxin-dependent thiol peroxidase [Microbacteriaceae bacterium]
MTDSPKRLAPGDRAPAFTLLDQDGGTVRLADFKGQRVVVYFYPAAMTPACADQACDFRDSLQSLAASGIAVVGISPDEPERLARFRERDSLNFPLLSDERHRAMRAYGTWGPKLNYGRVYEGVIRSTFVVDAKGRIEHALYNVKATGHVARLRKLLGV